MSDFMDVDVVEKLMKVGDLIVFDRGDYKHWGICIGEDVVHITGTMKAVFGSLASSSPSGSIDSLLDKDATQARVKCERLQSAAEGYCYACCLFIYLLVCLDNLYNKGI